MAPDATEVNHQKLGGETTHKRPSGLCIITGL